MNMNPSFGSWLIGMSLGAGGGMLGMASMFIVLATTTFVAALLYAVTGFGFAVLAAALSLVYRPGTGNSARHHHLDGAVDRCASGAVAGYRAVAAAALGARQSRWAAARPSSAASPAVQ